MKLMYIYIITNKKYGTLYIGVTNNLRRRIYEHKQKIVKGFSSRYNLNRLVYYEIFEDEINAIEREKQLKLFKRQKKIELINDFNTNWDDLYNNII